MNAFFETLKAHIEQHPPDYGDGESILEILYEFHNENSTYDNEQIKADFNELYQQMNGMPLREMDKIIYANMKINFYREEFLPPTATTINCVQRRCL